MANWLDGYVILTGRIEDILTFITTGTRYQGIPVHATVEKSYIVFSDGFIPEDLHVLGTTRAFIGFECRHDIKNTDTPNAYEVSVTWDQVNGFEADELSTIAKRYNLAIEAEGIVFELEFKQRIIMNSLGELLLNKSIVYHHEDYDPYDDYRKIK